MKVLEFVNQGLTELPPIPEGIEKLYFANNQITKLPKLPNSIKLLHCGGNLLYEIDRLPKNLTFLVCSTNGLTRLDNLPDSLKILDCAYNQLSILKVPKNLEVLNCERNKLTEIDHLPNSLKYINCNFNKLKALPKIPDNIPQFYVRSNPYYKKEELPKLPKINFSLMQLCRIKVKDIKSDTSMGAELNKLPLDLIEYLKDNERLCDKCSKKECTSDLVRTFVWNEKYQIPTIEYKCLECL